MVDMAWLLVSASLVFLMQAGFLCLESGRIRTKNSINVAAKNISDFLISSAVFNLIGFGLMFGASSYGLYGTSDFLFGEEASPQAIAFFFFQMMFCGTAATLVSGAVAERMTFAGYLVITLVLSAAIYPLVGHWAWNGIFAQNNSQGWLEALGFVDFAGSTVVHSVGGWVALVAVWKIGPRLKRFDSGIYLPQGSNLPLSGLGVLLIWMGWIGFNGGSTLALNDSVPSILLNTFLAAIWGGVGACLAFYVKHRFIDVAHLLNGVIAGLVGITAGCHVVSSGAAILIGLISGIITVLGSYLMVRWKLDDALDVVPAHLFAGIWGTLSVALFGNLEVIGSGLTRLEQVAVQALGVVCIGVYCTLIAYIALVLLGHIMRLRVSTIDEEKGLNVAEHHATTEIIDLLNSMYYQQEQADFSRRVPEEPFTEVGQIAKQYNQVIDKVNAEISERDQALHWFKESEMRKSAILNSSMDCIVTIDAAGNIIEYNPSSERTFGMLKRQVRGKSFIDLFVPPKDRGEINNSLTTAFSSSTGWVLNRRNHFQLLRGSDQTFPVEIAITKAVNEEGNFQEFTLHIRDVTRHVKLQDKLRFLAYSDPLTSLYNRTYMNEQLERALRSYTERGLKIALLFLDLDKFKIINDTLGHKAGDELLCEVSVRLSDVTAETDVIARWGGDEFLIMMVENVSDNRVQQLASSILNAMRVPMTIATKPVRIATSIGMSMSDENSTAETLIQQADIAMYNAKQNGRDNARFYEAYMADDVASMFQFEQVIKDALLNKQFTLVFQPQFDNRREAIFGLEALVRWSHPEKGVISPDEFIPIAEESNLICQIGEYVIEEVLQCLQKWHQSDIDMVPVAVNISGRHMLSEGFIRFIEQKLSQYAIAGRWLKIEITEGVFIHDVHQCIEIMTALNTLGVEISVDDFGTGYSSLNYLKMLPLDILKIDQSFVRECGDSAEGDKICEAIIQLAQNLDLQVIAEGVETQQQANILQQLGCHLHQGYHYFKPETFEIVSEKLYQQMLAPKQDSLDD